MTRLLRRRGIAGPLVDIDLAATFTVLALSGLVLNALVGSLAAMAFLGFGGLLLISDPQQSITLIARWWFLLLLPAYCMLSTLWSQYPEITLRASIQLMITLAIAVVMAGRVKPTTLVRALFVVYAVGILASVTIGNRPSGAPWLGIFGSKNAFAAHIAVFALTSLAVVVDRHAGLLLRLGALAGLLISGPLMILAQSAGAIMMVVPCVAVMVLLLLTGRLTGNQKLFMTLGVIIVGAALGLFIMANGQTLLSEILEGSGKDPTLTGRTDLWATAFTFIAERPLQGIGFRAFWVAGFAPAEQLWAMFLVPSGSGFNFHNTYISNAVEIGLIGVGLQAFLIYGGFLLIVIATILRPNPQNAFLVGLQLLVILRSFIEVEVFFEFSVRSILVVVTFIYGAQGVLHELRANRRSPLPASRQVYIRPIGVQP